MDATATTTPPQHSRNNDRHGDGKTIADSNFRSNSTRTNNHSRRFRSNARTTTINPKYDRPGRPKHAAFFELLYGTILYITCIFLPSFPRFMYQTYLWSSTWMNVIRERILWSIWICWRFSLVVLERWGWMVNPFAADRNEEGMHTSMKDDAAATGMRRFGHKIRKFIFSTSTASLWEEFNQQHQQRGGQTIPSGYSSPYTWGFGRSTSAFPAILMVLQDIQILIISAVLLAIIRVWFVHMLVPEFLAPRRLEAMTRCKSSHLLSSSSYSFGGVKGWDKAAERIGVRRESLSGRCSVDESSMNTEREKNRGWYDRALVWVSYHWYRLRPSVRRALGHEPSARYNDIVTSQQQQQQHSSSPYRRSDSTPDPSQHLFSAPRHATATFRLLYTSISCGSALFLFQSAEFWPRHVFGTHPHASTRHCWDLSGSFSALGFLDDDYDAKNGALKYYFLAQAAYQLHSLCFHIVSMILLLLYGGGSGSTGSNGNVSWIHKILGLFGRGDTNQQPQQKNPFQQQRQQDKSAGLISMKTSMQSYFRPMIEHGIVLALLIGAYLFSGLRRLGAVGIFTLEVSSVFLQLLQVCIYAPENSWWRKPEVVLFVHRVLTVPTFVYCRLIVLPLILWRSALFESQEWLEQIEKVFSPGWAERLYTMFNGSLCLIFALNLVLFKRLLFHPHLKQIVKQKKDRKIKHRL
eukprot:CAMPEP_0181127210 /NCGR_PEP_ID=MMETSP1071-20121207/28067_1 /TAXON_ID=35127 /ORGANISM="Thalassiosira sp., Strain NH16" /LENGTH=691 /DNA_ID=CAMNT_0023212915 /DNA_START=318 /DNA_END=2393 /DNA_ORIENTATION=+